MKLFLPSHVIPQNARNKSGTSVKDIDSRGKLLLGICKCEPCGAEKDRSTQRHTYSAI